MLHGVCSPFMLTIPTIGFSIAASSSPIARIKARCGVRVSPRLVISDRNLRIRASQQCTRADFMPLLPKRQTHKSPHWEERTYGYRYPGSAEREPGPAVDAPDDRR